MTPARIREIEKLVCRTGAAIRMHGSDCIDVEIKTSTAGYASMSISTIARRFGGHGFNPNGWTLNHYIAATAALTTLLELAVAIWDLCEVPA